MAVDKVLCKSMFGGFCISIVCREVKSIPRVSIPLRTQYGLFHDIYHPINPPAPGSWLIALGYDATWGSVLVSVAGRTDTQWWPWAGWSWWGAIHVAQPMHSFYPWHHATLLMTPWGAMTGVWGRKQTGVHRTCHLILPIIIIPLCWHHPSESIYLGHKYPHGFAHSERSINILPPEISSSSTFQSCFFQVPDHPTKLWPQPMNQDKGACLPFSPSEWSEQTGTLPKVLSTERVCFHHYPHGLFQKEAVGLQLSTWRWCLHILKNHL